MCWYANHMLPGRFYIEQGQNFQVAQFPAAIDKKSHQSPEAPALWIETQEVYWRQKMIKDQVFSQDHPCLVPQLSVSTYLQNYQHKPINDFEKENQTLGKYTI